MMNPIPDKEFDPDNFEPLLSKDEKGKAYRKRIKPPKALPTFGLKPKEILEGQMIGMYESKQDIYLIMAHRCNEMQDEINQLRKDFDDLKNSIKK
jgi:hypothetical protein